MVAGVAVGGFFALVLAWYAIKAFFELVELVLTFLWTTPFAVGAVIVYLVIGVLRRFAGLLGLASGALLGLLGILFNPRSMQRDKLMTAIKDHKPEFPRIDHSYFFPKKGLRERDPAP